ncbi:MAG: hypothetical protein LBU36_07275 [Clostridiales bacterium]|jgi:hypothetical protein|nr:hypothetical protein [Clostridiales bacterium]
MDFETLKLNFINADTDGKIKIYTESALKKEEYMELLRHFPVEELPRLEAALG